MVKFYKLLLPFEKFHIPDYTRIPHHKANLVQKLNNEILSNKYRLLPTKCLCGGKDFDIIATVDKYSVLLPTVMCRTCGTIQTNPRFSEIFYKELFQSDTLNKIYYLDEDLEHYVLQRFTINSGQHIIKAIEKYKIVNSSTKVAEIGSGAGWNLIPFINKGAQVLGLEYNKDMVQLAKKYNVPIVLGDENNLVGEYDIIILNHSLEHMYRPILSLLKITEHLKPNGIIYISAQFNLFFNQNSFSLPQIFYFTPYNLKYFVSEANLMPIKIEFLDNQSFYGLFKKGFYHNQDLLSQNLSFTKKRIKKYHLHETLKLSKKIKSINDVPGKIFFSQKNEKF